MTFIKNNIDNGDLYVTLQDIKLVGGTFTAGTILKKTGSDDIRGDDYVDFEGNVLAETRFCQEHIVPLNEAYKLFEPRKRTNKA